jgi:hypothetical protein
MSSILQRWFEMKEFEVSAFKPVLQTSTSEDLSLKILEDRQYELEFKEEFLGYMKRKQCYENNRIKAYAILWERCAKGMQIKIEAQSDFENSIKNNPKELLRAVKQHSLNYQEHRYEMSIILSALKTLINLRQRDQESLTDYTRIFKAARDLLVTQLGGPIILTRYVESMEGMNKNDKEEMRKCQEMVFEQFLAYTYLDNCDKAKYDSLMNNLKQQQSLKHDQNPKTIADASNVLKSHKFDNMGRKIGEKNKENYTKSKGDDNSELPELSFAQLEGKCYCCG